MAKRTVDKKTAFLKAYVLCADLTRAAAAVKMDRSNHYDWLKSDPEYPARYEQARREAGDTLEGSAARWALVGVFRQYTFQGRPQFAQREMKVHTLPDGREIRDDQLPEDKETRDALAIRSTRTIQEDDPAKPLGEFVRSEGLHARLLKAFKPAEYGDKISAELTGPKGGPIAIEDARLKNLTDDELAQLLAVAKKLAPDSGDGGGTPPAPPK